MGGVSFPSTIICCRLFSNSLPFLYVAKNPHSPPLNLKSNPRNLYQRASVLGNFYLPFSYQTLIQRSFFSSSTGLPLVPFSGRSADSGEEDRRALETVLKLYSAIKNKNIRALSDIIGDECRCVCNFFSFLHPFQGKKQVLDFFSNLIGSLGNNIEFVVQHTVHDGMNVVVSWRLEWKRNHLPLGKGFSFYMCHVYQGKVVIRNVEMFMEPLLHIEPFRLKIMVYVTTVLDFMGSNTTLKAKKAIYILLTLFFLAASLFFLKLSF